MEQREIPRRTVLKTAGAAAVTIAGPARAAGAADEVVIPWLDQPAPVPPEAANIVGHPLIWENLDSRHTPNDEFFTVKHYDEPNLSASTYRLARGRSGRSIPAASPSTDATRAGPAARSTSRWSVRAITAVRRSSSAASATPGGPARRWHPLLRQADAADDATEVVFWGADSRLGDDPRQLRDHRRGGHRRGRARHRPAASI